MKKKLISIVLFCAPAVMAQAQTYELYIGGVAE